MARLPYTKDSIERALDHHTCERRIVGWSATDNGRYAVQLNRSTSPDTIELRSLREAWIFVAGLASAGYTPATPATPVAPVPATPVAPVAYADNPPHGEGDGCAVYPSGYTVVVDGEETQVTNLTVGTVFTEYGQEWSVARVGRDGHEVHIDTERMD